MKQNISYQQFEQLSKIQQANMMKRWTEKVGDLIFCKPGSGDVFYGVITEVNGEKAYAAWDMQGTTAPTVRIMKSDWYPLFSYGQLVAIIIDLYGSSFDLNSKSIDDLWESVKENL